MLLQFYNHSIHIKYTLTKTHTHAQLNWDYLCESEQKSIRHWKSKVPLYVIKLIQQNPTTIYSQFFKYNNEIRSLIIHTKPLENPDNANKTKKKILNYINKQKK